MNTQSTTSERHHAATGELNARKHRHLPRVLQRCLRVMRFAQATAGASGASLFLVDADARTIGGLLSDWDWIRTSFAVPLGHWPTVGLALGDGQVHTIRAEGAHGDEARWFEPLGTVSTACVPLRSSEGAPLGVIFFDFDAETNASRDFLAAIGERVSRALDRDRAWTHHAPETAPLLQ